MPFPTPSADARKHPLIALMPGVFVVLWSTGFIGAKLGTLYAPPFTFLLLMVPAAIAGMAVATAGVALVARG